MKKAMTFIACLYFGIFSLHAQTPGNALDFDGSGDYVSVTLPSVFSDIANNDFTVETWVKPEGSATQRIFFAQLDGTHFASILLNATNTPYFYVSGTSSIGFNTSTSLATSQWSHIAVTWDASAQQMQMYINGALQTLVSGGSSSTASNNSMAIGSKTDGTQNLAAELDEFRIWNYVRTLCQINTGMHSEYTLAQPGLIAYYKFNEGTAGGTNTGITNLPDFNSTYNGTLINFALAGTASNWISSGAVINQVNQTGNLYGSVSLTICNGEVINFGSQQLTSSGIYIDTVSSAQGCDSIVTLTLTVNTVDTSVIQNGHVLTASASANGYQWLDCSNFYAPIPGANSQSFSPDTNGSYAVRVIQGTCEDTSRCITIADFGIKQNDFGKSLIVFPNPTSGLVNIDLGRKYDFISVSIQDITGKNIISLDFKSSAQLTFELPEPAGNYYIAITSPPKKKALVKVTKE